MPAITRPQLVAYAIAAVVIAVLGVRFMHQQARSAGAASSATTRSGARDTGAVRIQRRTAVAALIHVAGAVRRPGVYRLHDGQRIQDAIRRAGGARHGADLNAINLAAKVADGQQVVVPRRGPTGAVASSGAQGSGTADVPRVPVSLNSATAEQLDTLDGVGPATAQKILDWRRQHGGFRGVEDLGQVPGIGPKRLAALRDKVQP